MRCAYCSSDIQEGALCSNEECISRVVDNVVHPTKCAKEGDRLAILEVSPEFIVSLGWVGRVMHFECAKNGLPRDVEIIKIGVRDSKFRVILRHTIFGTLHVGQDIPVLRPPEFTSIGREN